MFSRYSITLVFLVTLLSACDDPQDNLEQLTNQELRTQWRDCVYAASSDDQPQACQNYETECQQRKQQDNFACY